MKNFFTFFILLLLVGCAFKESEVGLKRNNSSSNSIDISKEYSFEGYVNLLLNKNKSKKYPDINNIPD